MILAHLIVGVFPANNSDFSLSWFAGSIIPDIDHLFLLAKNRIFSWKKIVEYMRFSDSHDIKFKTKYFHSLFGAISLSLPLLLVGPQVFRTFLFAYLLHLLLDWPDHDEKLYLYPFNNKKFKGFLPIFSRPEIVFTLTLIALYCFKYF
ncbi:hypothetical protein HGA64_03560 [Candidatus Falkowbacteria bacterium]|nr:hypothetical protein [Candidatus Falkowbacteria bacterium]